METIGLSTSQMKTERRKEMSQFAKRQNEGKFTPVTEQSDYESGSESTSSSAYDDNDDDNDDENDEPGCYSFIFPSSSKNQLSTERNKLRILQDRLESANESTYTLTNRLNVAVAEKERLIKTINDVEHRHKQQFLEISAKGLITQKELAQTKEVILSLKQKNAKHVSDLLEMKEVEQVVAKSVAAERDAIMEMFQENESTAKEELSERVNLELKLNDMEHRHKQQFLEISAKGLIIEEELIQTNKVVQSLTQKNAEHVSDLLEMKEVEQVVAKSVAAEKDAIMEMFQENESKAKEELSERVNLETILLEKLKASNLSIFSLSQQLHRESKRVTDFEETRGIAQTTFNATEVAMRAEKDYMVTVVTALKNRNKELLVEMKTTINTAKDEFSLKFNETNQKLSDEIMLLRNENAKNLAKIQEKQGTEDELSRSNKNIVIKLNNEISHLKSNLASQSVSGTKCQERVNALLETNSSLDKQNKKVANDLMSFTTQLINSLEKKQM
jgi:deoxycytidylate deaminase